MKRAIALVAMLTVGLVTAFALTPAKTSPKKFNLIVAYQQDGSPVSVASVTHGREFLFESAELKNLSDKTIRSLTFGVLLRESLIGGQHPKLASQREISTNIGTGETKTIEVMDATMNQARSKAKDFKSDTVILEFGLLAVKFADGTSWNFDLKRVGKFSPGQLSTFEDFRNSVPCKETRHSKFSAALLKYMPSLGTVLAQDGYTCGSSPQHEVCTNMVTSCTNRVCLHSELPTCPNQHCVLQ